MSHTAKIELQLTDKETVKQTAKTLGIKTEEGTFSLFSTKEEGIGLFLPGWKYPAVVKEDGSVAYDNYNGKWGNIQELYKFKNKYAVEKTKKEAKRKGYAVKEEKIKGKIRLTLTKY